MAEKQSVEHYDEGIDNKPTGHVKEANVASVKLAAALAADKPSLLSKNMIQ